MTEFVHDPRHRFSYELRPDSTLDAWVRALATELETDGLLAAGASIAPRFHPHVTLCRAAVLHVPAVEAIAACLAETGVGVTLDAVGVFGHGRIVYLAPADPSPLLAARNAAVEQLDEDDLDPLVIARPWIPHLTVAYAVPAVAREAVVARVRDALPATGSWERAQSWDLDVRPTRLGADVPCVAPSGIG